MKKLFMLLALVLGVVSCQTEPEGFDVVVGGEQDVNITVSLPDETRADSAKGFDLNNLNGYKVRYILEISYNNRVVRDVQTAETTSVVFPVRLAPGRDYQFTVWADLVNDGQKDLYYNVLEYAQEGVSALSNITFKTWTPNTEARDAWTDTKSIKFGENPDDLSMTLTRPFAKVRVVATDIQEIRKFGLEPTKGVATYKAVYTSFDAVNGVAGNLVENYNTTLSYDINADIYEGANGEQLTVFADYILVPADGNVQFSLSIYADEQRNDLIKTNNFNTLIPVERNKVTSIVGDVLTEGGNVNITVDGNLGVKETFTYISSGAQLIAQMNAGGNFILGNDVTVTDADVATRAYRRNTENEPKKTTIDLNGYTITVKNTSDKALVTIAAGNTLFLEGGNIVLAEGSTASFIKNDGGNVVLTNGTLENESNHNTAAVVEGKVIAEENATVNDNNTTEVENWLADVLANGGTYLFTEDLTSKEIIEVTATAPVVLDGNGFTLTSSAGRAINVSGAENVTIKNLNIVASGERAINIIQNATNITIENVTATAANYTVNVAGSAPNANVVINNSDLTGLNTVNIGAEYTTVVITNTKLTSDDKTETESYDAISINKNGANSSVTVNGGEIVLNGDSVAAAVSCDYSVVTFNDTKGASNDDVVYNNFVIEYGNYAYTFTSLNEALKIAKDNEEVIVARSFSVSEPLVIEEGQIATINLNGKTINAGLKQEGRHHYAIDNYGTLTLKGNGFINARGVENFGTMTVEEGVTITNVDTNGGAAIWNEGNIAINGGTFKTNESAGIGSYGVALNTRPGGKATVNNGTFKSYSNLSYAIINAGETTIYNANVEGKHGAVAGAETNDKTAIYGGTFKLNGNPDNSDHCAYCVSAIYGGTFSIVVPDPAHGDSVFCESKIAEGYEVVEVNDGNYTVVPESTVAMIGKVCYTSLDNAVTAAQDDDTVRFVADVEQEDGVIITDKNITIDLNGKTFTVSNGANTNNRNFKVNGSSVVTIKNGTLVAYGELTSGAYGTVRTDDDAVANLENLKLYSYRGYGLNVKANTGTTINIKDSEIYAQYSGGVEAAGGNIELTNVKIDQTGVYSSGAWCSVAIGVNGGGKVTVNSGNYSASAISTDANAAQGTWVAYVMSSGGTLDIKGGTFNGVVAETAAAANACGLICADRAAVVEIHGGTFNSNGAILDMRNNVGTQPNPRATLFGGTFSADPRVSGLYSSNLIKVADGYKVVENNGRWTVVVTE